MSSVAPLMVSGSSCSPACDRWSKTTRSLPAIPLLSGSANCVEQRRSRALRDQCREPRSRATPCPRRERRPHRSGPERRARLGWATTHKAAKVSTDFGRSTYISGVKHHAPRSTTSATVGSADASTRHCSRWVARFGEFDEVDIGRRCHRPALLPTAGCHLTVGAGFRPTSIRRTNGQALRMVSSGQRPSAQELVKTTLPLRLEQGLRIRIASVVGQAVQDWFSPQPKGPLQRDDTGSGSCRPGLPNSVGRAIPTGCQDVVRRGNLGRLHELME